MRHLQQLAPLPIPGGWFRALVPNQSRDYDGYMTTKAAPGELELVREFVNTLHVEDGIDSIGDPAALKEWLAARRLLSPEESLGPADVARAAEVREALRGLLLANHGEPVDPADVEALNRAGSAGRVRVRFGPDGTAALEPDAAGLEGALGKVLALVATAVADGTWPRLKACRRHDCEWAFYDRSKNRSRSWCAMEVCGNRTKAEQYRKRHAAETRA